MSALSAPVLMARKPLHSACTLCTNLSRTITSASSARRVALVQSVRLRSRARSSRRRGGPAYCRPDKTVLVSATIRMTGAPLGACRVALEHPAPPRSSLRRPGGAARQRNDFAPATGRYVPPTAHPFGDWTGRAVEADFGVIHNALYRTDLDTLRLRSARPRQPNPRLRNRSQRGLDREPRANKKSGRRSAFKR
jgi:hypothetical protein